MPRTIAPSGRIWKVVADAAAAAWFQRTGPQCQIPLGLAVDSVPAIIALRLQEAVDEGGLDNRLPATGANAPGGHEAHGQGAEIRFAVFTLMIRWLDPGQRMTHAWMSPMEGFTSPLASLLQWDVSRDFLRFHLDQVQVSGRVPADLKVQGNHVRWAIVEAAPGAA